MNPRELFVTLKPWLEDSRYRVYHADDLDAPFEQDYAVVWHVREGQPYHVAAIAYIRPAYDAFWRLIMWNNRRLDSMSVKEDSHA